MTDPANAPWWGSGRMWLRSFGFWLAWGCLFTAYIHLAYSREDRSAGEIFFRQLVLWGSFAPFTPAVFTWGRRIPGTRPRARRRMLWRTLLFAFGFSVAHIVLLALVRVWWGLTDDTLLAHLAESPRFVLFDLIMFFMILGCGHALGSRERILRQEHESEELRGKLVEAQLAALKMQLQPHFLFNTLHAIGVFARRDPEEARRMIALVGDLLRQALESSRHQEVALDQELEFLRPYLEIQRIRFEDRLRFELDVDEDARGCLVPNLLLQPLVENAVRHGVEASEGGGSIHVKAARQNGWLDVEVRDDGAGLQQGAELQEGVGLGNTRARLLKLYGDDQSLRLDAGESGGVVVRVRLPARTENGA